MTDQQYTGLRTAMVDEQLIGRGIRDAAVLRAFRRVPRHLFVDPPFRAQAYDDHPLPIDNGQTISQPYMAAFMTECLHLTPQSIVLEIGTGSGYHCAILAEIVRHVYSVERIAPLADRARTMLTTLGYHNFSITVGDGTLGLPAHAPYTGILVTAGAPHLPQPLLGQLADDGALVIPIGTSVTQVLTVAERHGASFTTRQVGACSFVPLIGAEGWAVS